VSMTVLADSLNLFLQGSQASFTSLTESQQRLQECQHGLTEALTTFVKTSQTQSTRFDNIECKLVNFESAGNALISHVDELRGTVYSLGTHSISLEAKLESVDKVMKDNSNTLSKLVSHTNCRV
jgi:hypothetical protein